MRDDDPKLIDNGEPLSPLLDSAPVSLLWHDYLRHLRESRNLSYRYVQHLSRNALSAPYLSQLEQGKIQQPSVKKLQIVAKVYGIDYADLLSRVGYLDSSSQHEKKPVTVTDPALVPVTPKEEIFCRWYVKTFDRLASLLKAGYQPASRRAASVHACVILKRARVKRRIDELMDERLEQIEMDKNDVLHELVILMKSDVNHFYYNADTGRIEVRDGAPPHASRAISSLRMTVKRTIKPTGDIEETVDARIALWSKPAAIRMAGEHLLMFAKQDPDAESNPDKKLAKMLGIPVEDLPK